MSNTEHSEKQDKQGGKPTDIKVTVTFPLAAKPPYKDEVEPAQTAEVVRTSAMTYFGVADEPTATYYLTHKGDRVGTETVGSFADEARAVKFTIAKELIQG